MRLSKRKRLKLISATFEKETLEELAEFAKTFNTITRTEIIRFAVEWVLMPENKKKFTEALREID